MTRSKRKQETSKDRKMRQTEELLYANATANNEFERRSNKLTMHDIKWCPQPKSQKHQQFFDAVKDGFNVAVDGEAGTGKTSMGLYLAISDILNPNTPRRKVIIVRSLVQGREIGFLPGSEDEKMEPYEEPYRQILADIFGKPTCYEKFKEVEKIEFVSTSFLRGVTWDHSVVLVDEAQNMNFAELDTIMGRIGKESKVIIVGDTVDQIDLTRKNDVSGFETLMRVIEEMDEFVQLKFTAENEGCRSKFVQSWCAAKKTFRKNNP